MCDAICGDDRFEIIDEAKRQLLKYTNIETSPDEMKVIDTFLFRCWQMGWLNGINKRLTEEEPTLWAKTKTLL